MRGFSTILSAAFCFAIVGHAHAEPGTQLAYAGDDGLSRSLEEARKLLKPQRVASPGARVDSIPGKPAWRVFRTRQQWRRILTRLQFYVLRQKGTEIARTGQYDQHKAQGVYVCAGCKAAGVHTPLYGSKTKFESGTGWPSFWGPVNAGNILVAMLTKRQIWLAQLGFSASFIGRELDCAYCGGHLGHVFKDGPAPTGERHCINSAALYFVAAAKGAVSK